ncbi:MAG: acyl-CoA dehydrogenase family protein, partial [Sphingobium sp.]
MSDGDMLIEAADRLFGDLIDDSAMRRARGGGWLGEAWDAIAGMGLPLALVEETAGGFGIAVEDALALVRLAGRHALPLPLGETMLANRALGAAGLPLADGAAALIDGSGLTIAGGRIAGTAERVPWARDIATLVVVADGRTFRIGAGCAVAEKGTNLAQMPRDTLSINAACDIAGATSGLPPLLAGAAIRSIQIAGALERVLDLTVSFVSERVQFGRSLSKFQAVQHDLARLGGEVAAAGAAADMAVEALAGDPARATLPIA